MTIRTVQSSLAADVTANGTFTVSYPAGTNSGSYTGGMEHRLVMLPANDVYKNVKDFTLTLGTSNITVTLAAAFATTLKSGTAFILQLEKRGQNDLRPLLQSTILRAVSAYPALIDLGAPTASNATNVCAAQAMSGANALAVINGTLAGGSPAVATLDCPRTLQYVSSNAGDTTQTVIVNGTDEYGVALNEKVTLNGTSVVHGKKAFKIVKSATVSATMTGNLSIGTDSALGLPYFLDSISDIINEYQNGVGLPYEASKVRLGFSINQTDLLAPNPQQLVSPISGTITNMQTIVEAAVTTGGTIVVKIGTTATTGGVATIANAATLGTINAATAFTALNVVAVNSRIQIVPASFATAGQVSGFVEITPSNAAILNGTVVTGDQTSPQAQTTGDVRGTYQPSATLDGVQSFQLVVLNTDPTYLGMPQT